MKEKMKKLKKMYAFKSAIENLEDYKIKKGDYDKRMAEKEEEENQRELEKKENED